MYEKCVTRALQEKKKSHSNERETLEGVYKAAAYTYSKYCSQFCLHCHHFPHMFRTCSRFSEVLKYFSSAKSILFSECWAVYRVTDDEHKLHCFLLKYSVLKNPFFFFLPFNEQSMGFSYHLFITITIRKWKKITGLSYNNEWITELLRSTCQPQNFTVWFFKLFSIAEAQENATCGLHFHKQIQWKTARWWFTEPDLNSLSPLQANSKTFSHTKYYIQWCLLLQCRERL